MEVYCGKTNLVAISDAYYPYADSSQMTQIGKFSFVLVRVLSSHFFALLLFVGFLRDIISHQPAIHHFRYQVGIVIIERLKLYEFSSGRMTGFQWSRQPP